MSALVLPCDPVQLDADVARLWLAAAETRGVESALLTISVEDGRPWATWVPGLGTDYVKLAPAVALAMEELCRSLEDIGYAIERDGPSRRVLGWVAAPADPDREPEWTEACALPRRRDRGLVRICDLPSSDPRRVAYNSALLVARNATEGPEQS